MLPDGFKWLRRWQYAREANGLFISEVLVAYVDAQVGGGWFARLDCQQPIDAPLTLRRCHSLESGRRGCEIWATRHEERLRREVADVLARRPGHAAIGEPPPRGAAGLSHPGKAP